MKQKIEIKGAFPDTQIFVDGKEIEGVMSFEFIGNADPSKGDPLVLTLRIFNPDVAIETEAVVVNA